MSSVSTELFVTVVLVGLVAGIKSEILCNSGLQEGFDCAYSAATG